MACLIRLRPLLLIFLLCGPYEPMSVDTCMKVFEGVAHIIAACAVGGFREITSHPKEA